MTAAAVTGEQSLWAVGVPRPNFPLGLQGGAVLWCCFQLGSGEPSLWAVGVLGPDLPHGLQEVQFCGAATEESKPAGLHLLLSRKQWEPRGLAYIGVPVSLVFQGKGSRLCIRGEHMAPSFCVCQEAGPTAE
jgi:hypothetical protein